MRTRFKVILRIIFVLILLIIISLLIFSLGRNSNKVTYKVVDKIEDYNYSLEDRDSKLMQDYFSKLKETLEKDDIDFNLYANYLSSLFIIDLFTISNKDNKYDVGSIEYVYPKVVDNYKLNVEDTIYKYVNSNDDDKYPTVKDIKDVNVVEDKYTYDNNEFDAFKVNVTWDYEKDLGYYKQGEVTLIKDGNKLYVVSFKGAE